MISFDDYLAIKRVAFEWVESYDTKDWPRLHAILADSIRLDLSYANAPVYESLTPSEFSDIIKGFIGSPFVKTQHLLGAEEFKELDNAVQVTYQARAIHQGYEGEEVVATGTGYGAAVHVYKKFDKWKLVAVTPMIRFAEGDIAAAIAKADFKVVAD